MASQTQIRQQITDQFIEALKAGGIPPWARAGPATAAGCPPTSSASGATRA